MQNPHFRSKIKISKNMPKSVLQIIYSCSVQNNAGTTTKYSRNESIMKVGHHAKPIAHAKIKSLTLAQKSKFQKTCKHQFYKSFTVVLCKKALQKKNTNYSRNESILKIALQSCKAYSPCKILTLAQKFKLQKTCQNPCYKSFTVLL